MNNTDIPTAQSRRDYTLLTVGFSLRSGAVWTLAHPISRIPIGMYLSVETDKHGKDPECRRHATYTRMCRIPDGMRFITWRISTMRLSLTGWWKEYHCPVALGYCLHRCARYASNILYKLPRFCFAKLCRMEIYLYKLPRFCEAESYRMKIYLYKLPRRLAATPLQNLKGIFPLIIRRLKPTANKVAFCFLLSTFNSQLSTFNSQLSTFN